ncbi:uncharacterized protein TEOVI_000109400 [Trypanosoma equiperdum]|uniref:Uncharacterized protein n=1 Tax=Trypanosoma equiperdum TaxID=5694 RepID=A0A1G4IC06_TRYEQ|nr:hypothetical protein, conserved [Trypanosoma equiperdum]
MERVQTQAVHIVAGISRAANREDAVREARLKSINAVAQRRVSEYYLGLKVKGPTHAQLGDSIFSPEHPVHFRLATQQRLYSTIDGPEKSHDATVLRLARHVHFNTTKPGGLKADGPEKDKKVHTMWGAQLFKNCDYRVWTDGFVVPDVSSGAGALAYRKEGWRERVVLGAGSPSCRTRVPAFTDLISLLMVLSTGPEVVEGSILGRIWDLILSIVRLRVSVNFHFVFSHCGVPRNEAANKAAEHGNAKPQPYPACITDIVTGAERQVQNAVYNVFEEGRMPRTHLSVILDHVRPAPKRTKLDRLGEPLLPQFRTGTSKHFGWLRRVVTRTLDQLGCRWCNAQEPGSNASGPPPAVE